MPEDELESPETASADPKFGPKTLAFLAAIRACPSITRAARAAEITRESHYRRLERSPAYREAFERAYREGVESLEDEAVRRAQKGVQRPVLYHGLPVMILKDPNDPEGGVTPLLETEYSDTLLLALLKAKKPDTYKDRVSQEVTGADGGPIMARMELVFVDPDDPDDDAGNATGEVSAEA